MEVRSPAVSVLMPVRDAEAWLEPCLGSLFAQTLTDFEIVAVDDGSTDASRAMLEAASRRDRRLRVLDPPSGRGQACGLVAALNHGLEACRGALVARMDADDIADPRRLALQRRAFEDDPRLDVCSCLVRHFPVDRIAEGFRRYDDWLNGLLRHRDIVDQRFVESPIAHPTAMLRRDTFRAVGGYRQGDFPEDYDLWLRLAARGARFVKVPEMLHHWRDHDRRLTRRDPRYAKDRFLALKARYLASGPLRGRTVVVWGAGATGKRLARHLAARGTAIDRFLDIDPKKIGGRAAGRPVADARDVPRLIEDDPTTVILGAVAARGARLLIRDRLVRWGLREGTDFLLAS